jgi:hypothetical protein
MNRLTVLHWRYLQVIWMILNVLNYASAAWVAALICLSPPSQVPISLPNSLTHGQIQIPESRLLGRQLMSMVSNQQLILGPGGSCPPTRLSRRTVRWNTELRTGPDLPFPSLGYVSPFPVLCLFLFVRPLPPPPPPHMTELLVLLCSVCAETASFPKYITVILILYYLLRRC